MKVEVKMKKKLNVTVFGDSLSKGMELKKGKPAMLKTCAVKMLADYYNIDITNCSGFGQTITRLKEKGFVDEYIKKVDKKYRNIVVFCIGGNDSDFDWKVVGANPDFNHQCKTPLSVFKEIYTDYVKKLQRKKVEVYLCALPVVSAKKFFEGYISSLTNPDNVLKFFKGDITIITRHQEIYSNAVRDIATTTKSKFLDIRTPFLNLKDIDNYYCDDGLHPNEKGHKLIADAIIKQINLQ